MNFRIRLTILEKNRNFARWDHFENLIFYSAQYFDTFSFCFRFYNSSSLGDITLKYNKKISLFG